MPRVYHKKNLRTVWSKELLEAAAKAVQDNRCSVNAASKDFKIPRRTLRDYLLKRTTSSKLGRNTILSPQLEADLCERIIRLANVGYPVTSKIIRSSVYTFCVDNNIKHNFNNDKKLAGPDWLKSFLARHPEIAKRKSQSMNPGRASKLNPVVVGDYFKKLETVIETLGVMQKPECMYNVDEKGCRLCLHKEPQVYAQKGSKNVRIVGQEHGENVTIVSCGNALGNIIPPMILFKGFRMKSEWMDGLPPGSIAAMTPKGSMTCEIFAQWLDHLAKYKSQGKCLLIFDGAKCHLDYKIVEAAENHQITLFCLPSQTTHELQPFDKSVFGPFETYWDQEVLQFMRHNPGNSLTKQRFSAIFTHVWDKVCTPANIKAGFRATGIYPFQPDIIPDTAFAPSTVTHMFISEEVSTVSSGVSVETPSLCIPSLAMTDNPPLTPQANSTAAVIDPAGIPGPSNVNTSSSLIGLSVSLTPDAEDIPASSNASHSSSFKSILSTPHKVTPSTKRNAQSVNKLAVVLKKELFPNTSNDTKKLGKTKKESSAKKNKIINPSVRESWYCPVCHEDKVLDMRRCLICEVYFHELCVGLTKNDKEKFVCPYCS